MTTKELRQIEIDKRTARIRARFNAKQALFKPQQLRDPRFMSAAQKRAHAEGQEIWV